MKKKLSIITFHLLVISNVFAESDTVGIKFTINDSIIVTTTSSKLDFGDVIVSKGDIAYSGNKPKLTVKGSDFSNTVKLSVPQDIVLTNSSGATLSFNPSLEGSEGTVSIIGNNVTWNSISALADATDTKDIDFGGSLSLSGTELSGTYMGTAQITVQYN